MKWTIIVNLITLLIKQIDHSDVEDIADKGLDYLEDHYPDNAPLMVTCSLIRRAFSIEDND